MEVQISKLYCVNKAVPTLPINIEDAARSEVEIEQALEVLCSFSPVMCHVWLMNFHHSCLLERSCSEKVISIF